MLTVSVMLIAIVLQHAGLLSSTAAATPCALSPALAFGADAAAPQAHWLIQPPAGLALRRDGRFNGQALLLQVIRLCWFRLRACACETERWWLRACRPASHPHLPVPPCPLHSQNAGRLQPACAATAATTAFLAASTNCSDTAVSLGSPQSFVLEPAGSGRYHLRTTVGVAGAGQQEACVTLLGSREAPINVWFD